MSKNKEQKQINISKEEAESIVDCICEEVYKMSSKLRDIRKIENECKKVDLEYFLSNLDEKYYYIILRLNIILNDKSSDIYLGKLKNYQFSRFLEISKKINEVDRKIKETICCLRNTVFAHRNQKKNEKWKHGKDSKTVNKKILPVLTWNDISGIFDDIFDVISMIKGVGEYIHYDSKYIRDATDSTSVSWVIEQIKIAQNFNEYAEQLMKSGNLPEFYKIRGVIEK